MTHEQILAYNRYGAAAMACLPLFWRMMQCLGRYSTTKHIEVRPKRTVCNFQKVHDMVVWRST